MLDLLHNSIFKLANEGHFPVLEDLLLLLLIHKNQFKKNLSGLEFVLNTIVFQFLMIEYFFMRAFIDIHSINFFYFQTCACYHRP